MTNAARTYFWATQFYQDLVTNTVTRECVDEWRKTLLSSTEIFLFSWVVFSFQLLHIEHEPFQPEPAGARSSGAFWWEKSPSVSILAIWAFDEPICIFNSCLSSFLCLAQDWDLDSMFLTSRNRCHFFFRLNVVLWKISSWATQLIIQ